MDESTESNESPEERAARYAEIDKQIPSPGDRAESVWRAVLGHDCPEWKAMLEKTDNIDLAHFSAYFLAFLAQEMPFIEEEMKAVVTRLHIYHYEFYAPSVLNVDRHNESQDGSDNKTDEGDSPAIRIVK